MAFSVVQSSPILNTGGTSVSHTWAVAPTPGPGRKIIVFCTAYGPPATITATDNATPPNTYTSRISEFGDSRVSILDADIANVPTITTITMSAASDTSANIIEVSGLAASGAYDSAGDAQAGGAAPHTLTPAGTLAQADNVQFGAIGGNGGAGPITLTPPTGFTLIQSELTNAFIEHGSGYRVIATTTPGSSAWTSSVVLAADVLVAYKLAASDVTLGLNGLAITSAQGALGAAVDKALTGIAATSAQGAFTKTVDKGLTGSAVTASAGTLSPVGDVVLALSGYDITSSTGALSAATSLGLIGLQIDSASGTLGVDGVPVVPTGSGAGSEIGGRRQYRNFKPLLQRVLDAKSERRVRPEKDRAAKRAKALENQAAALVMEPDTSEAEFEALAARWAAENPIVPPSMAGLDPTALFMAQVAFRLQQQQLEEQARAMAEAQRQARIRRNALLALLLAA